MALGEPGDVAPRLGHQRQHGTRQRQQPLTDRREAKWSDILFDHRGAEMALQGLELMRQCGLCQAEPFGGLGKTAAFGQGQEGLQMPELERCGGHEMVSSFL